MKYGNFIKEKSVEKEFILKDGRKLITTNNNFKFWVVSRKNVVEEITENQFNQSLKHQIKQPKKK
ncbi:hypothetical protein Phi47:1_gp61 [Cellulophaga phage phi47:1]|nr:hypothetical protein CDPG_00006 [Cellulophaga phage phi47:1]AGO47792.1 hypothetical protein Phi3ST:2_gp61 [Cellulophaga phage phi3ST:2]AGO48256.1 hypothetical protein PhiSM_gp61 [Cellulophaga phage phiSM]AGO49300.1 hypothetical protein Phi38:2_gp61 [Cellulophaga phage phi38:2]AGO49380.1 hypothetical protein Phi3:1_gp61 [Cellulophaga phage phi3:1]